MRYSLAYRLALAGSLLVLAALLLAGALTMGVVHLRAVDALDQALLAAAHAHSGDAPGWEVEHSDAPVEVWVAAPGDRRLPAGVVAAATDAERPIFHDLRGDRVLLLPAEFEEESSEREEHLVIVARAPAVTLARSVGPFAAVYAVVAGLSAALAALGQLGLVRLALRPIERGRAEADAVVSLGQGRRLTEAGPDELVTFLRSINGLLDRLDAAHRAQARFTDQAAHELRTPIAVLLGELELALRRPRSAEEYKAALASMREEVERLAALVEGLLVLARLDAGTLPAREVVLVSDIAAGAARREAAALQRVGSRLEIEVRRDGEARVNRALVETALANLLRNAAVHAPGSEVRLMVDREGDRAVFAVEDQGPGVPPEQREAVFDRLSRGGQARRYDRQGLGLGLPLAAEIARRHGGSCVIEEAPGGGARVVLTIQAAG